MAHVDARKARSESRIDVDTRKEEEEEEEEGS